MSRPNLDERQRRILKFVVESHVMRAEPVGSQYVRMAYHLSISPATIRSAMKRLEEEGLLDHPHTSAGRVPTEAGYRYYVDILMEPEPISPATKRALERKLGRSPRVLEDFQKEAADALAQLSGQLAMVALGPWSGTPIRQLRIGGAENIAAQPEFQTADRLRALVSLLARPEPLTRALDSYMGSGAARITIGRELGEGAMRVCSLVGTGVASSRIRGSVGVLGPVRMPYPRLLSLVSYVGERLAEFS
jgi:transcriptional regulator of heat shock response